jgi:hypothetical protein
MYGWRDNFGEGDFFVNSATGWSMAKLDDAFGERVKANGAMPADALRDELSLVAGTILPLVGVQIRAGLQWQGYSRRGAHELIARMVERRDVQFSPSSLQFISWDDLKNIGQLARAHKYPSR